MTAAALLLLAPAAALAVAAADWTLGLSPGLFRLLMTLVAVGQAGAALLVLRMWQADEAATRKAAEAAARDSAARDLALARQAETMAIVAHEIRTPLGGLHGLLDLLLSMPELPRAARADAAAARQASADLLALLRELIEVPGRPVPPAVLIPFRIDEVMEQVVALLRARALARATRLSTAIAFGTPAAWVGEPARLRQILTNLAVNAITFTEGGEVRLEAREAATGALELRVSDTGRGIPPERMATLFDRFQPSETGTGLGLSICRDLTSHMGGSIEVQSTPGRGTIFTVTLPLRQVPADQVAGILPSVLPAPASLGAGTDARPAVLVVDDVPVNRRLLAAMLERMGYAHDEAGGGEAALAMLQARPYAAVLMDLQMPGMDGIEATRLMRTLPGPAGRLPVVAVTAQDSAECRGSAANAGMDGYLVKPVSLDELATTLRSLTQRSAPVPPA